MKEYPRSSCGAAQSMVNVRGGVVSAEVIDDANDYSTTLVDCAFKNCGLVSSPGGYILVPGWFTPGLSVLAQ